MGWIELSDETEFGLSDKTELKLSDKTEWVDTETDLWDTVGGVLESPFGWCGGVVEELTSNLLIITGEIWGDWPKVSFNDLKNLFA